MELSMRSRSRRSSSDTECANVNIPDFLRKELTATFKMFDKDGDGKISRFELRVVLASLGDDLDDFELDELIKTVDIDGDGCIDLGDFITFHASDARNGAAQSTSTSGDGALQLHIWSEETDALQAAFDVFDADKDGFISAEELRRVMLNLGDKHASLAECRHMIESVDKDGDHMVNFNEFQCLMSGTV